MRTRNRWYVQHMVVVIVSLLTPLSVRGADARDPARVIEQAFRSYQAGEMEAARQQAEAAFRLTRLSKLLVLLSQIDAAQGRDVEAADLARRYLSEVPAGGSPDYRRACEEAVRAARGATGELSLRGKPAALVFIDDRLVGALPLSLPLLLRPGAHRVRLEHGARSVTRMIQVESRGRHEQQLDLPPALILVTRGIPESGRPALVQALSSMARKAGVFLLDGASLPRDLGAPPLPECLAAAPCRQRLARQHDAAQALWLSIEQVAGARRGSVQDHRLRAATSLLPGGAEGPALEGSCQSCTEGAALLQLRELAQAVLSRLRRPMGLLAVTTSEGGAEVHIDGRRRGVTPYEERLPRATHRIEVVQRWHAPYRGSLHVEEGENRIALRSVRAPRPRWRLVLGPLLGAAGGVLAGFGASALAIHQQTVPPLEGEMSCATGEVDVNLGCRRYDTLGSGGLMIGIGAGAAVAGTWLAAWPGSRRLSLAHLGPMASQRYLMGVVHGRVSP